jgi:hypothetical protein
MMRLADMAEFHKGYQWLTSPAGEKIYLRPGIGAMGRIIVDQDTVMRMILKKLDFINESFDEKALSEGS